MNIKRFSSFDLKYHFKQNQTIYFMFLFCMIVGIVVGFVIIFSSTNYITLLTSESKMIYPFINGTAETAVYFWKRLLLFLTPMLLMFLLGLNYYLSLLNEKDKTL